MRCERCGEGEAEVHLTKIVDNELTTVHLCEACAEEQGVAAASSSPGSGPLADFLAEMGKGAEGAMLPAAAEDCPYCGTSASDFRRTGRLGCSHCWAHFEDHLTALLRRLHGSTQHVGKIYLGELEEGSDAQARLATLQRRLQQAIEVEDFETAAHLRDRIREIEVAE